MTDSLLQAFLRFVADFFWGKREVLQPLAKVNQAIGEVFSLFVKNGLKQGPFWRSTFFIAFLAVTLCLVAFYSAEGLYQRDLAAQIEETHTANKNVTRLVEENVRLMLSQADNILLVMKIDMETHGFLEEKHVSLLQRSLGLGTINQIAVADSAGNLIFSAVPLQAPLNIALREHFRAQVDYDSDKLYIAAPWINRATGTPSVFLSRRINDSQGNFAGIVSVGLDQKYFTSVFSQLELGRDNSLVLLRTDGRLLARVPNNRSLEELAGLYSSHIAFSRMSKGENFGTYEAVSIGDGIARYGAFRAFSDYPLLVLAGTSKETVMQPLQELRFLYFLRAGFFSLLILGAFVVIWLQMRKQVHMTRALSRSQGRYQALMAQAAEAIAVADFATGTIFEVNEAYCTLFGIETLKENLFDFWKTQEGVSAAAYRSMLQEAGSLPMAVFYFNNQAGKHICVQRAASLIHYEEEALIIVHYRDITLEQKLANQIEQEVKLAGEAQRRMLPGDYADKSLVVQTVYQPVHFVSGDFFSYAWSRDHNKFYGYVLDVAGHGMATALHTSAITNLLDHLLEETQGWTTETMAQFNEQMIRYFQDDSFLAMIAFEFDFSQRQLRCLAGGMNHFMLCQQNRPQVRTLPGSYLGIGPSAEFETLVLSFQPGDAFYFFSDGLYEQLPKESLPAFCGFSESVAKLKSLALQENIHDDCSAVCIQIQ